MRTRIGPAITLLALSAALPACKQPRQPSRPADTTATVSTRVDKAAEERAIRDLSRRWEQMFAARDTAGIAALFAEDGYEMPPNAKAMKGPEEVRRGIAEMLRTTKDFKLNFSPSSITIADAGDLAVERGTYRLSFTGPRAKRIEDHGNYVTVYRKVGGEWKVIADINASEVPMPL